MSLRFRRRLTLFPGVKINFSKSGISTTFGIPGASINIGKDGTYFNAGIPGTGFYTRTKLNKEEDSSPRTKDDDQFNVNYFNPLEPQQIKSEPIDKLTSDGLKGLKETLIAALKEEKEIKNDINSVSFLLQKAERSFRRFKIIPFAKYIFKNGYKRRQNEIEEKSELLNHLERQLELCNVDLVCESFNEFQTAYDDLKTAFSNLINSHFIWDIVTNKIVDRVSTRSAAHQTIERKKIQFNFKTNSFIKYKGEVFHIENFNGADIYMYPGFLLLFSNVTDFALVDYKDLEIKYAYQNFIEDEQIPRDTHIIYQTWAKVNKDGSRDLRFRDNYQIPVVAYGNIHFFSSTGVNEIYMFSNNEAAKIFCEMFVKLKSVLLGVDNN